MNREQAEKRAGAFLETMDLSDMPEHMHSTARLYVRYGIDGGSFFTAVVENDLWGAFKKADHVNKPRFEDIVDVIHHHFPSACWGNREAVEEWIRAGGLVGKYMARGH